MMTIRKKSFVLAVMSLLLLPCMAMGQTGTETQTKGPETAQPQPASAPSGQPAQANAQQPSQAPAAAATPQSNAPATGSAEDLQSVTEAYNIKLKGLEEKVNELKEKVFKSKARLLLLQETVLTGRISAAKATIVFDNDMSRMFKLESFSLTLDGALIFNKTDQNGDLNRQRIVEVLPKSNLVAGNHNVSIYLIYAGSGGGIFSYLEGYKFKMKSNYTFTTEEGKVTSIKVVAYEKGGITTDLKERPTLRFDVEIRPDVEVKRQAKPASDNNANSK